MGTNFYWRDNPCQHCDRHEEIHVGKSQHTWRAYRHALIDDLRPEWGHRYESPVGFGIVVLSDWRRVFTERPGQLFDEYGVHIPDPIAWLDEAKAWKPGEDGWKWLDADIQAGTGWLDEQGFRFYAGEFC